MMRVSYAVDQIRGLRSGEIKAIIENEEATSIEFVMKGYHCQCDTTNLVANIGGGAF